MRLRRTSWHCVLIGLVLGAPDLLWAQQTSVQPAFAEPTLDLFSLEAMRPGDDVAAMFRSRAVRGHTLPDAAVLDSAGARFLRLSGTKRAGGFAKPFPLALADADGRLEWEWRALIAPEHADVGAARSDDAAIRVFVVFASHSRFSTVPRTIFYTLGNGQPAWRTARAPTLVAVMLGTPAAARSWTAVGVNPRQDYQRLWGQIPPPIRAVGVMQDTDQTMSTAVGDVRHIFWRASDAPRP
jgi:hypothetical protein